MSLEAILYVLLGFLSAVFLALLFLPLLWKRAVYLTERKAGNLLPHGIEEVEAQKDQLRAEHAMKTRRLELGVTDLREKASQYLAQLHAQRDERNQLRAKSATDDQKIANLERQNASLNEKLATVIATAEQLSEKLKETSGRYEELQFEHIALQEKKSLVDAKLDRAKIELVARSANHDDLDAELAKLLQDDDNVATSPSGNGSRGKRIAGAKKASPAWEFSASDNEIASLNEDLNDKTTRIVALEAELTRKVIDDELKAEANGKLDERENPALVSLREESNKLLDEISEFGASPANAIEPDKGKTLREKISAFGTKVVETAPASSSPPSSSGKAQQKDDTFDMNKSSSVLMNRIREIQSELKARD